MNTSYRVISATGTLLGIFPKGELFAVKSLVGVNPGASVQPVVTVGTACIQHAAYEADNCPDCGTGRTL